MSLNTAEQGDLKKMAEAALKAKKPLATAKQEKIQEIRDKNWDPNKTNEAIVYFQDAIARILMKNN